MPRTARGKEGKQADTHTPALEQQGAFINKKDGWNGRRDVTWEIVNASGHGKDSTGRPGCGRKSKSHMGMGKQDVVCTRRLVYARRSVKII